MRIKTLILPLLALPLLGCPGGGSSSGGGDAFAKTSKATGDPQPLSCVVWPADSAAQPAFVKGGDKGSFKDGNCIELMTGAKEFAGANGGSATFIITLEKDGDILAGHEFDMGGFTGSSNFWLIADPAATTPNPSFTDAFLKAVIGLGGGSHALTIKVFGVKGEAITILNSGELTYEGGTTTAHEALVPKFKDVMATRAKANEAHAKAEDAKAEAEAAKRAAADDAKKFKVTIKNEDTGHTKYVITKDFRGSESISEVLPGKSKVLKFSRGQTFELLWYDQNQKKESATSLGKVNESKDGQTFTVR